MKRINNLYDKIISDENISMAIDEVNKTHRWVKNHRPNQCTAWVEETKDERISELREFITNGFEPHKPRISRRWDVSAGKWRMISEPLQYPDQYIHHALIQVLQPILMRKMDLYCCGSIRGRGTHYGKKAIERWLVKDQKGTKYTLCCDIYHFYDSLQPEVVMERMRHIIKDGRTLELIWSIIKDGISIGAYTSQWFANTALQPLDMLIRQSGYAKYGIRYMDNFTIFSSNKRHLKKLRIIIENWLNEHGMRLKGDWQIFRTDKRMPDAVGFRYGRGYTIPRKRNFLRLKRAIARYRKKVRNGKPVSLKMAQSIMSRLGQLRHCNNVNLYKILFKGERIVRQLKRIIREHDRKGKITWDIHMKSRQPNL